jgi:4-amino-4-deoxy-L-arabinose transferase-like glycosyltransferase
VWDSSDAVYEIGYTILMKILFQHSTTKIVLVFSILFSIAYFWTVALYDISNTPGIFYDEAKNIAPAIFACSGVPWEKGVFGGIFTNTISIPLTLNSYRGFVEAYLLLPFLKVFGLKIEIIRFGAVLLAFFAAIALLVAVRNIFGLQSAAIFAILLLTNNCFIFHSRLGIWGGQSILWLTTAIAFLNFSLYETTKKTHWIYIGFFSLGVGTYNHQMLLFFVIGLLISSMLFLDHIGTKVRLCCLIAFLSGFSPFLITNIFSGFSDIQTNLQRISGSLPPHKNSFFINNIITTSKDLHNLIKFSHPDIPEFTSLSSIYLIFLCIPLMIMLRPIRRQLGDKNKYIYFLIAIFTLYFIAMSIDLNGLIYKHLLNIIPLLYIINAVILSAIIRYAKTKGGLLYRSIKIMVPTILGLTILLQVYCMYGFFLFHHKTGGHGLYACSYAQKNLSKYLIDHGFTRPVALDWGISFPLMIYSDGKVVPIDIRPCTADNLLTAHRRWPNRIFINIADDCNEKTFSKNFLDELHKARLKESNKQNFADKLGNNIFSTFNLND